jgi:dipeptidyl aminopeptidase/acylaminoacyl peptidase
VHTTLIGNVPVSAGGVADVNLSGSVRQASPKELSAFSAQLVWTLRQISDVTAVRLLAEGAPLTVPGTPVRQPITAWQRYDPSAPPSSHDVLYVSHGHLAATGGDVTALSHSDPGHVSSVARSRDGDTLAVVQQLPSGMRLLTGTYGEPLKLRLSAATLTPPTFDSDGDILTVADGPAGRRVMTVTATGAVRRVAAESSLTAQPVSQLSISRDGARVAAVVGAGRLLVGRVAADSALPSLAGFRAITPSLSGVRGVSWAAAEELAVTASASGGQREIVVTDADGYAPHTLSLERLRGQPVDVDGAPGQPLIAVTDRNVIWVQVEGWRRIAAGTAAVHSG